MYLNPNLNLKDISDELSISKGYVSNLINKHANKNFNDYINHFRVEEIKKMLIDSHFNKYTVLAIGLEAGFNSKSSFNNVFKKFTNLTPSAYKDKISPKS